MTKVLVSPMSCSRSRSTSAIAQERALEEGCLVELPIAGEFALHPQREVAQKSALVVVEGARLDVEDAQRADLLAARRLERVSRVEPQVRVADDEGVRREQRVGRGILHHERLALADRHVAEGAFARRFIAQADVRFPPLAVVVHERDAHHRHVEELLREAGHAVDALVGRRVEHAHRVEGALTPGFIDQDRPPVWRLMTSPVWRSPGTRSTRRSGDAPQREAASLSA